MGNCGDLRSLFISEGKLGSARFCCTEINKLTCVRRSQSWRKPSLLPHIYVSHFPPRRIGVEDFGVRRHQDRPGGEPQEADPGPAHVLNQGVCPSQGGE